MASAINDRYELIETIPAVVGDFVLQAYKVRETVPPDPDIPPGRVVMLREIARDAYVANVISAAQRGRDLGRHPNILVSYGLTETSEAGSIPAGVYVVSEYARGISLRERIRRVAPFSLAITLEIAIAIAQAVQFAAQKGVSHGHLCPEQILLTPEGQVRVADFGLAAAVHHALADDGAAPTEDIKALGAIIHEMVTAAAPALISPDGLSPRLLNANVPPALDGIVRKATTTNTALAYTSIANMLVDLQACREDLRNNKPLNWSPLGAAAPAPKPQPKAAPGLLTQAAGELAEESRKPSKLPDAEQAVRDEPLREGSPILGRLLTALTILAVVGFIAVVCVVATMLSVPTDITVPNLVGKSYTDAQAIAKAGHFSLVQGGLDYNDTWPANTIYLQDPLPGRSIKSGKNVTVSVSNGPPLSAVPDLTQMTLTRAKAMLDNAGLTMGTVTQVYDDVNPKGIITGQDPAAPASISHKVPVNVTVSKGPSPPATPDGLSASASIEGEIDLSWNPVSNASTYNLYRDGTKIATGLSEAAYSDERLGTGETHHYTVTAVNGNGESAQSAAVAGTTLLPGGAIPAVVPPPPAPVPDNTAPTTPAPSAVPRPREFHIRFRVPRRGDQHHIQITTQDITGINTVYDEMKAPGEVVETDIQGTGNKVVIRVYIDSQLEIQQNR